MNLAQIGATLDRLDKLEAEAGYYLRQPSVDLSADTLKVIQDLHCLIPSFRETLERELRLAHDLETTRNELEAWKSCLNCGNTRAEGDFWEAHCPACKGGDA